LFWSGSAWDTSGAGFPTATALSIAGLHFYDLPGSATSNKVGASVHFNFTDNIDESTATSISSGGEHLVVSGIPASRPDLFIDTIGVIEDTVTSDIIGLVEDTTTTAIIGVVPDA